MLEQGLHFVEPNLIAGVENEAAQRAIRVFRLAVPEPADRRTFFGAVRATLPLDPPLVGAEKWDALSDSLWGGIHGLTESSIVIIWPDAAVMKISSPADYEIAIETLRDIAITLADVQLTIGAPKELCVYISSSARGSEA